MKAVKELFWWKEVVGVKEHSIRFYLEHLGIAASDHMIIATLSPPGISHNSFHPSHIYLAIHLATDQYHSLFD